MTALQAMRAPILMSVALVLAFAFALFLCGYVARTVVRMDGGLGKPQTDVEPIEEVAILPETKAAA